MLPTRVAPFSAAENTTAVTTVSDPGWPLQAVTFSITGGADAAKFSIQLSTGALNFNTAPDFEAPSDTNGDNVYLVQVTANDGAGGTATQDLVGR